MTFLEFSKALITTQDLDPDYVYLREILKDEGQFNKIIWIQHKVFIYDTASEYMFLHGKKTLDELKYGAERRKNKRNTAVQLDKFLYDFNLDKMPKDYLGARDYLKKFPGMGDWAAWKFCDLLERVADIQIDFSKVDFRTAYVFPLKGLCRANGLTDDDVSRLKDDGLYRLLMNGAKERLAHILSYMAPPNGNRTINIQEIETCLCKYHSYLGGHYKIGQDTAHLVKRFNEEGIKIPVDLSKFHNHPLFN